MAAQLFDVSLRTFREDYIKGKNQKRSYLLHTFFSDIWIFYIILSINLGDPRAMERERENRQARNVQEKEKREEEEKNNEN